MVVFLLDAARADRFGCYGYAAGTTPHVDALAREGIVFEQVVSEAASTFPATAAFMTGRSPTASGLLKTQPIPASLPTLAERFRSAGYRTYAYSENPFITDRFGFDRGFDSFRAAFSHGDFARDRLAVPSFGTEDALRVAVDWMAADRSRPFFAYFHVLRPHNPYTPPAEYVERLAPGVDPAAFGSTEVLRRIDSRNRSASPEDLAAVSALYDANLAYGDALFGQLASALRERGLWDGAVVAVLADHGEGLFEHGHLLHTSTVYDEMIRVPAVVRLPGGGAPRRVSAPVQLRELGDALAAIAAAPPGAPMEFAPASPDAIAVAWTLPRFARAAARSPDHKLIVDVGEDGCGQRPVALFDLGADPAERIPLDPARHPEGLALIRHFAEHGARACDAPGPDHGSHLDPATEERLRALGYLDPQ